MHNFDACQFGLNFAQNQCRRSSVALGLRSSNLLEGENLGLKTGNEHSWTLLVDTKSIMIVADKGLLVENCLSFKRAPEYSTTVARHACDSF